MSKKLANKKIIYATGSRRGSSKNLLFILGAVIIVAGIFTWLIISSLFEKEVFNQVVTPDNVDQIIESIDAKDILPTGSYEVLMNTTWNFSSSEESSYDAYIANSSYNSNTMYFTIRIEDSDEDIYTSPYVPVGSSLEDIRLDTQLKKGSYDCVLTYHLVDEGHTEISKVSVSMTIVIQN